MNRRNRTLVFIGILVLSGMFLIGQEPNWPSKPTIAVISPTSGELVEESISINIAYTNGDIGTLEVTLDDDDITSDLEITESGASGVITAGEEKFFWLRCSISNSAGTAVAERFFHYSPTGFDPGVSSLTETEHNQILDEYPLMSVLNDDLIELAEDVKGYTVNPISRLEFRNSQGFMIATTIKTPNSESYDGLVHLIELKIPPVGTGPLYWAWIWEWLSPTSFKWYLPNCSVTFDYSDPENPVLTFDPPLNGNMMQNPMYDTLDAKALPIRAAFSCFGGGTAAMGWLTCFGAFGGSAITCALCIASGGANLPACGGCFFGILVTTGACGSCDLCTYPWCN